MPASTTRMPMTTSSSISVNPPTRGRRGATGGLVAAKAGDGILGPVYAVDARADEDVAVLLARGISGVCCRWGDAGGRGADQRGVEVVREPLPQPRRRRGRGADHR